MSGLDTVYGTGTSGFVVLIMLLLRDGVSQSVFLVLS